MINRKLILIEYVVVQKLIGKSKKNGSSIDYHLNYQENEKTLHKVLFIDLLKPNVTIVKIIIKNEV